MGARASQVCCDNEEYPDHSKQINRINRLIGQLTGVKRMVEERRYCPDILTQTKAISAALRSLEASMLETHLEHCVRDAFESANPREKEEKIAELLDIFKSRR